MVTEREMPTLPIRAGDGLVPYTLDMDVIWARRVIVETMLGHNAQVAFKGDWLVRLTPTGPLHVLRDAEFRRLARVSESEPTDV